MFKPKPIKDVEINPEPPQRDWRDHFELVFRFLWFFHKTIIGLILLIVVGLWCFHLATRPPKAETSDGSSSKQESVEKFMPSASLEFGTTGEIEPEETAISNLPALPPSIAHPDADDSATDANGSGKLLKELLATGSVDDLIEQSLKIHENWGQTLPSVGLLMCTQRAEISRRLLAMDLSDAQRTYALTAYIDSVSIIDSLNVASKMNIAGTREALAEIDEKFSIHPNPTVYAKAHLAMTSAPLYDFIATGDLEHLHEFQTEFRQRLEKIAPDQASLVRLAELSVAMLNKTGLPAEREPVVLELLNRMKALETPSSQKVVAVFRDRLLYDRYQLASLAALVEHNDETTRKKVQAFFQTLAENPNSEQRIYQTALQIADAHRYFGKVDDSDRLLDWIDKTSDNISVEENRQKVKDAIEKLRAKKK